MGKKIPVEDLEKRTRKFFDRVVDILVGRNSARGDSYLEMDLSDFATMFRNKGDRIRTIATTCDLTEASSRRDLCDSILDEAGWAALAAIWVEEFIDVEEGDWANDA